MIKGLKISGVLLIIVGVLLLFFQILNFTSSTTRIGLPGNVKGFSDVKIINEKEVKMVFAKAENKMIENVDSYKKWNNISIFGSWAAFFLGAIITLLAGYLGYNKTENFSSDLLQSSLKHKVRLSKIIGLLAAGATIMTGFSVKAKEEAEARRTKGLEIRDLIIASYKDVQQAKPEEVTFILEKLKLQSNF
jgi:hypothetical protein